MYPDPELFLSTIRDWFSNDSRRIGDTIELSATGISPDGAAVILFHTLASPELYGRRFPLAEYSALTGISDTAALGWEAIGEIAEPSGRGKTLNVDWADSLCDEPSTVRWLGNPTA